MSQTSSVVAKRDLPTALTRTVVPYLVGLIISLPAIKAVGITSPTVAGLILVVITQGYYQVSRRLEQLDPRWGRLLGAVASAPIDAVPAALRTYIPLLVAFVLGHPITGWLQLDGALLTPIVTTAVAAGWYVLGIALEQINPLFGLLLGSSHRPLYRAKHTAGGTQVITDLHD